MPDRTNQPQKHTTDWPPLAFALVGILYFLIQAIGYAHSQASVLDEGAYLYKGLLYVTGQYQPFQDFGPWTNHMPLSFLIHGWLQVLIGPGLRVARYSAVCFATIGLIAYWLTARRLAGPWWAVLAVWLIALNPAVTKTYAFGASQVLVFCLFALTLYFGLGPKRSLRQLIFANLFAAILLLTRVNLSPVFFFLALYLWWEHGYKKAFKAVIVGLLVILVGHLAFSPGIFSFWLSWLPDALANPISAITGWEIPPRQEDLPFRTFTQNNDLNTILSSLALTSQVHYIYLTSFAATLVLWLRPKRWRVPVYFKSAVFLLVNFALLFAIHAWATLSQGYCVFCLENYMSFFNFLGPLVLVILLAQALPEHSIAIWRQVLIAAPMIGLALWFGTHGSNRAVRQLLKIELPRFSGFRFQPGSQPLWGYLENFLGWPHEVALRNLALQAGFLLAALLVGIALLVRRPLAARNPQLHPLGVVILISGLVLSALIAPSPLLAGYQRIYDCGQDVIASNESVAEVLQATIPPGAQIYWRGGLSAVPMLYIPDAHLYPPQINANYAYYQGGEDQMLLKAGRWNTSISTTWLGEADYALVSEDYISGNLRDTTPELHTALQSGDYTLIATTPPLIDCRTNGPIYIYQRLP